MTAENTSQDGVEEALDYAITHYVNRGLIHEDRWTDLKTALKRLLLQERLDELKQAKFKLIHAMPLGLDDEEEMMLSGDYLNYRIATLTAQLYEMEDE